MGKSAQRCLPLCPWQAGEPVCNRFGTGSGIKGLSLVWGMAPDPGRRPPPYRVRPGAVGMVSECRDGMVLWAVG